MKMREILFRGKGNPDYNEGDGSWFEGYLTYNDGNYQIVDKNFFKNHIVIKETIGQYTGLNDKNGKKIYEGDIIDFEDRKDCNYGVIKYSAEFTEFYFEHDGCYDSLGFCYHNYDLEIVGNIYDNPDLI